MNAQPLTASEAAALLGVSARTVIRMVERNELAAQRIGSRGDHLFDRSDVIAYLDRKAAAARALAEKAAS